MKKLVAGFFGITLIFFASLCWAAYVIHLKDGRDISTHEYWEEGDEIKIKQFGGVVGIAKKNVLSIEEADDVKTIVVKTPPEKTPEAADEKGEMPPKKEEKKEIVGDSNKKPDKPAKGKPPKEKNPIEKEFESLKKRFQRVDTMPVEALLALNRQLKNLRNKIIKAGLAGPYADQMVEIYDMITRVEEVYHKKKNQ
jgi:hypothetical protein